MKKLLLSLVLLLIVGAIALFMIKGKDGYDASKYSASLTKGVATGSTIEFTLPDQFDRSETLGDSTKTLILTFTKETGHIVKEFLGTQPADYMVKQNMMFVADISPMPVVIRNTFALPDLKSQNFSVKLIYDKAIADTFKKETQIEKIAILTLENKVIQKIEYASTLPELKAALQ